MNQSNVRAAPVELSESDEEPVIVERADGLKHPSPLHARAFLGLVRAGQELERELDAQLKSGHGLGLRAFEVLLHLAVFSSDGSLRIAQLTEQAPLSQSRVSRMIADLEADQLVKRSVFESDSRGVVVSITDAGLHKLRESQDTHIAGLRRLLFSRLDRDEIATLARLTERILEEPVDA